MVANNMLLAVHCKKTDQVDIKAPILKFITATYGDRQANDAADDLANVQQLRNDVSGLTGALPALRDTLAKRVRPPPCWERTLACRFACMLPRACMGSAGARPGRACRAALLGARPGSARCCARCLGACTCSMGARPARPCAAARVGARPHRRRRPVGSSGPMPTQGAC